MRVRIPALIMLLLLVSVSPIVTNSAAQQPDIVQEHWYHSYLTLTTDVQSWATDHPDIVTLTVAGQTELGRNLWVVQISDWTQNTKPDGTPKEIVYIDGGHHGNEHLGTELAFLTAEYYIEGWAAGEQEVIDVLTTTELHILIMLNADGNDIDTRWNINQVDLNRNYDHYWNTCETTQPGSSAFSESETLANSNYMNTVVPDADLYVTMHTGVWIMLYPWGKWPDQPSDWELFHGIRDEVHANISEIPIQNANQGLYPNCGTSRDYGYGIMGFPTFTFETDDEQWALGTVEPLSSRLGEELDVMNFLIENVWYWRARLNITSMEIVDGDHIHLEVENLGHASTANATLQYLSESGELLWNSSNFSVNASNSSSLHLDASNLSLVSGGLFQLHYQKRVINSAQWVTETIPETNLTYTTTSANSGALSPSLVTTLQLSTIPIFAIILAWIIRKAKRLEQEQEDIVENRWQTYAWTLAAVGAFGGAATSAAWYMFSYHTRMLGGAESLVALQVGLVVVGFGIGATIFGSLADRFGRRREMLLGTAGANVLISLVMPFLSLYPFMIVATLQAASLGVVRLLFSMTSEIFPNAKSESNGLLHSIAWAIASVLILVMGKTYGDLGLWSVSGLVAICMLVAILCVLNIGDSLKAFIESSEPVNVEKMGLSPSKWLSFTSPWPLMILAVVLAISIPRGAVVLNSPRYLEFIGFDISFTSVLISWAQLASVVLVAYAGFFCARYGASTVLLWSAIAYCSLWSAFSIGLPNWLAAFIYVLPVYGFLVVSSDALMSEHSTLSERNRAIGLSSATTLIGQGLGITLMFSSLRYLETTSLSQVDQYHWTFRLSIPLFLLSVFLAWRLVAKLEGHSQEAILVEAKSSPSVN